MRLSHSLSFSIRFIPLTSLDIAAMALRLCAAWAVATPATIRTASVTTPTCVARQFIRFISSAHIRQEQHQQRETNLPNPRILERPSEHPFSLYAHPLSIFSPCNYPASVTIHSHPTSSHRGRSPPGPNCQPSRQVPQPVGVSPLLWPLSSLLPSEIYPTVLSLER